MKQAVALLILILVNPVTSAFPQTTISYDAEVTFSSGPHASVFPVGEEVVVSYTLDSSVTDAVADPQRGVFLQCGPLAVDIFP